VAGKLDFLFGQFKRLTKEFNGVLTGKGLNWVARLSDGSNRIWVVYFTEEMLKTKGMSIAGKTVRFPVLAMSHGVQSRKRANWAAKW